MARLFILVISLLVFSHYALTHGWTDKPREHKSNEGVSNSWQDRVKEDSSANAILAAIAKKAREQLDNERCDSSPSPPGGLKCAFQVSKIIDEADESFVPPMPVEGSDSVVGVVDELTKKGWKASEGACPLRIPGSIVFTNPEFTSTQRSHIGIVGPNGEIIHNQGQDGTTGCLVSSDPADAQYSKQDDWYNNVRCLIPPTFNVGV